MSKPHTRWWRGILALLLAGALWLPAYGQDEVETEVLSDEDFAAESWNDVMNGDEREPVRDYIEPVNRVLFGFNDALYFYAVKPVARGYAEVVPEEPRSGVANFFSNLAAPMRAVNCLLQRDVKGTGTELSRFVVNTTWGILGFGDPAARHMDLQMRDADFGQTLGMYGMPEVTYINWPIFGPSNVRDTVGMVGDSFLDPVNLVNPWYWRAAIKGSEQVNLASFPLAPYEQFEDLKDDPATLDFYISVRNGYTQSRQYFIEQAEARLEAPASRPERIEGEAQDGATYPLP